tara:strand:+ start:11139 stop:11324 length:186 start_codon:yes stop_codon:yes gene_type:complete
MTEAVQLIEKQLGEVRNKIQGSRERCDNLEDKINAEEKLIDTLKEREIQLKLALAKLTDKE